MPAKDKSRKAPSRNRMFLLSRPSDQIISRFLDSQRQLPFTYEAAGDWSPPPRGYTLDHNRIKLGKGERVFRKAIEAINRWEMFNIGWIHLCWADTAIEAGATVAVLAQHFGFWSLHACRIVKTIDEDRRFGFTYGTLSDHAERGQERFLVEWRTEDDSVWYDILAYSRPNHLLARLGYPITRMLQKRFARDSMRAMLRSTSC
jgi:uncharacterized protein (UPF0548 family)